MLPLFSRRASPVEVLTLMRNLSVTLKAGVPLTKALSLFELDSPLRLRPILRHLRRSLETGHPLAQALQTSPRAFPPLVINLVRTGELGGTLRENLEQIVRHLKKVQDLKRKIRSAMMYPMFVLVALVGLGLSVSTLVLPELLPLFESLDVELPWTTRVLLKLAAFFELYSFPFTIGVFSSMLLLFGLSRLEAVRPFLHRCILLLPYVRVLQKQSAIAYIAGTLATLLRSGIPIQEAVLATADATNNRIFRRALQRTIPGIKSGHTFSHALSESGKLFPEMTVALVDIGESTGTLIETLEYLAEYYEGEVEYSMRNLTVALEPLLLILIGLLVGGTVLSIITPIYDVTGSIQ